MNDQQKRTTRKKRTPPQRKPGNPNGNGKSRRNPAQLERQARVFTMHVLDGKTVREIAGELEIDTGTVLRDIRAEADLRAEERKELRDRDLEIQIAKLDDLFSKAIGLKDMPAVGGLQTAAKVLEMRAKLFGLDAPTRVDIGLQTLLDALEGL